LRALCLFAGTCITGPLAYLLGRSEEFSRQFSVKVFDTGATRPSLSAETITDYDLERAAVVIHHPERWRGWRAGDLYLSLLAKVPSRATRITVPYPTMSCLWPCQALDPRYREASVEWEDSNSALYANSDCNVLRMRASGKSPIEILETYRKLDLGETLDLAALERRTFAKQRLKEASCDVKIMDFVEDNFQSRRTFTSINHGANITLAHMAAQILSIMGLGPLPSGLLSSLSELLEPSVPIHPSLLDHYGLKWATPGTRYQVDRRRMLTWEEYILTIAR